MNKVNAVMVGGLFDENGISAFARPVLFGTAGDAMRDALPDAVEACFFAHDDREPAVAGAQDIALDAANRFASLAALPESEHVLVLAAPFALAEEDALFHLAETHLNTGYGVSVLSAEQQGFDAEGQPLPRDSRCYAAMFTWDMLKKALASGADTLDGLVAAAVAAGAQKGIAITNKIYVICDGTAAFMAQVEMMQRVNYGLIKKGVQIFDLTSTYIAPDADIAPGATILPGCHIRPGCKVGAGAVIGPNTILEKAEIGAGTTVNNSQVYESTVGSNTTVGPFAYLRPHTKVGAGCKVGDFVEMKNSSFGDGSKAAHLTYVGDADVGSGVNLGCGVVFVNYDGTNKYRAQIGNDVFVGCNSNLVSPVQIGDGAYIAAGSTVTEDVEADALYIARSRGTQKQGWVSAKGIWNKKSKAQTK